MAYNNNIPLPGDQISVSQADLLNNFVALQTLIDVNHVDFASADQGKHKWVSFPQQGANPSTLATEVALFSKVSALSAVPELFFRNANNGAVYEFTSSQNDIAGFTRFPSGILIKWGYSSADGQEITVYPVGANIPVFANVYSAQVSLFNNDTLGDTNSFIQLNSFSNTQMNLYGSERTTNTPKIVPFHYLVIGI